MISCDIFLSVWCCVCTRRMEGLKHEGDSDSSSISSRFALAFHYLFISLFLYVLCLLSLSHSPLFLLLCCRFCRETGKSSQKKEVLADKKRDLTADSLTGRQRNQCFVNCEKCSLLVHAPILHCLLVKREA